MVVPVGEETEINLRQFSRKVEIKGFNRERIEKGREDEDHNMTYGSRCQVALLNFKVAGGIAQFQCGWRHCSISKWPVALLSFKGAGGIPRFQSGWWHCSVSMWPVPLLSFKVAAAIPQFPSGWWHCSVSK